MLTVVFGVSAMSETQVQSSYNQFKEGQEDVNDDRLKQPMKTLKR